MSTEANGAAPAFDPREFAKGLTNAQIAEELYLSIETVKTYVKRLYAKLDVHNRAQAAVAASDLQLTRR